MTDRPDFALTTESAARLHDDAAARGDLLLWTITARPSDYPDKYVARPHSTDAQTPLNCALFAPSLGELRAMLPLSLSRLPRYVEDDPVIVEVWL